MRGLIALLLLDWLLTIVPATAAAPNCAIILAVDNQRAFGNPAYHKQGNANQERCEGFVFQDQAGSSQFLVDIAYKVDATAMSRPVVNVSVPGVASGDQATVTVYAEGLQRRMDVILENGQSLQWPSVVEWGLSDRMEVRVLGRLNGNTEIYVPVLIVPEGESMPPTIQLRLQYPEYLYSLSGYLGSWTKFGECEVPATQAQTFGRSMQPAMSMVAVDIPANANAKFCFGLLLQGTAIAPTETEWLFFQR